METALVTGAGGFLGSHLVDRLLADGYEVWGLDNFSTVSPRNLTSARSHRTFHLLRRDLIRPGTLPKTRTIYHLASPASPPRYQADPVGTLLVNSLGTLAVLRQAARAQARVVLASTSEVYGDPEVHPQPETYWGHVNPIGPRSCYDEGKRFAEALSVAFGRTEGVDVRIARIFNTYGPRMALDDGRVVSNFIVQGLRGKPLTVQGRGDQTRSFCYVSDLVEGLRRMADAPPRRVRGPVNLGNPRGERTVAELAELICKLTGGRSEIRHIPRATDDPEHRRPDLRRARSWLGWEPRVPLAQGLEQTVREFRERLGNAP